MKAAPKVRLPKNLTSQIFLGGCESNRSYYAHRSFFIEHVDHTCSHFHSLDSLHIFGLAHPLDWSRAVLLLAPPEAAAFIVTKSSGDGTVCWRTAAETGLEVLAGLIYYTMTTKMPWGYCALEKTIVNATCD